MTSRLIVGRAGVFTCEITVSSGALDASLAHAGAEGLFRCANIVALGALTQGGAWPDRVMRNLAELMSEMRAELFSELDNMETRGTA